MYKKVLDFVKYNNAFTIILGVTFLSFGISFAASPAVRDSVYSSSETVVSIDNSLVISTDLDNFDFNLKVGSITQDDKNYYVVYTYQTLVIEDGVWQTKEMEKTLKVNIEALDGKDLGLFVAKELGDNMNYELSYLKRVQKLEQEKGQSQKIVNVQYSGLIGKLLNSKEKVIEGYNPVIAEAVPEPEPEFHPNPEPAVDSNQNQNTEPQENSNPTPAESTTSTPAEPQQEPVIESTSTSATSTPEATSTSQDTPTTTEATSTPEVTPEASSITDTTPPADNASTTPEASSTSETATE